MKELAILNKKSILFLCTGNSCRSQIAEGFGKRYLTDYSISSAGTEAHGMNPNAIKTMKDIGIDISCQKSAKINLSDPIKIEIIKDNLDTPTTAAIKGNTAWVLQAQFGHLFGDEKDIPPGPFEIAVVEFKPTFLTSIKKLINFLK